MAKWTVFLRSYEPIRQLLLNIDTYGCYDVQQILSQLHISRRYYENLLALLRYIWPNLVPEKNKSRRLVHFFPFDRYEDGENFLWRSFRLRSFQRQDINLYFLVLSFFATEERALDADDVLAYFDDEVFGSRSGEESHRHMVMDKLEELAAWGILVPEDARAGCYHIAANPLDEVADDDLVTLHDLLYLYRDLLPLASVGYALQQELGAYLRFVRGEPVAPLRTFLTKDIFLQTMLNDEIVFALQCAMERNRRVAFSLGRRRVDDVSPWRLIFDVQDGRQYLWGLRDGKEAMFRLDRISDVWLLRDARELLAPVQAARLEAMWAASVTQDADERHDVTVDFSIDTPKDAWRLRAMARQCRQGTFVQDTPLHGRFTVSVRDPRELLPWIRLHAPFAVLHAGDRPDLVAKLQDDWQAIHDVYEGTVDFQAQRQEPSQTASALRTAQAAGGVHGRTGVSSALFPEYRNLYYSAVRDLCCRMVVEGECVEEGELRHAICEAAGVQETGLKKNDGFRTEIAQFGGAITKLSLFRDGGDGRMEPSFPGELPPILLSPVEKRYLHTLLCQPLVTKLLGEAHAAALAERLSGHLPFSWDDTLLLRGQATPADPIDDALCANVRIIRQAIHAGACLAYQNQTKDGCHQGVCKPYRIMYSPKLRIFQLITAAQEAGAAAPRLVLMNVANLSHLAVTAHPLASVDVRALLRAKRTLSIELRLRNLPQNGNSDAARAFMLFSTYTKHGAYDEASGLYTLRLDACAFEREELISKILSLGQAVEVVSPPDVRAEVAGRIARALHTFGEDGRAASDKMRSEETIHTAAQTTEGERR